MSTRGANYEDSVIRTLPGHVRRQMGQLALAGYKFECMRPYWRCYRPDGSTVTFMGGRTLWTDLITMIESVVRWDGFELGIIDQPDLIDGVLR